MATTTVAETTLPPGVRFSLDAILRHAALTRAPRLADEIRGLTRTAFNAGQMSSGVPESLAMLAAALLDQADDRARDAGRLGDDSEEGRVAAREAALLRQVTGMITEAVLTARSDLAPGVQVRPLAHFASALTLRDRIFRSLQAEPGQTISDLCRNLRMEDRSRDVREEVRRMQDTGLVAVSSLPGIIPFRYVTAGGTQ